MYCSDTHSVSSTKKFVNSDYNDQHRIFHAGSSGTRRYNVTTKTSCLSGKKNLKEYIFSLIKGVLLSKSDIIMFTAIFQFLFIVFVVVCHLNFGMDEYIFSSPMTAYATCLRMMFGEY